MKLDNLRSRLRHRGAWARRVHRVVAAFVAGWEFEATRCGCDQLRRRGRRLLDRLNVRHKRLYARAVLDGRAAWLRYAREAAARNVDIERTAP